MNLNMEVQGKNSRFKISLSLQASVQDFKGNYNQINKKPVGMIL